MIDHLQLALPVGTILKDGNNEYVVIDPGNGKGFLGQGGFGITYLAREKKLERKVAIKEFFPSTVVGRDQTLTVASRDIEQFNSLKKYFLGEARHLAGFDDPRIVKVLAFFEANNTAYMVMPYLSGDTVSDRYKKQTFSESQAKDLLLQLVGGLKTVHANGVLHRDIKPDNIKYDVQTDTPILIDFGSARTSEAKGTQSTFGAYSPHFSPIELNSTNTQKTAATDVYALAATAYRAMFRSGPPDSAHRFEQDDDGLPELEDAIKNRQINPRFADILKKCLRLRAKDRFQSLDDLEVALGQTKNNPIPSKQRRQFYATSAAVIMVSLGIVAGVWHLTTRDRGSSSDAVIDNAIEQETTVLSQLETTVNNNAQNSLDATQKSESAQKTIIACNQLASDSTLSGVSREEEVGFWQIDPDKAVPVCRDALAINPSDQRILFQFVRSEMRQAFKMRDEQLLNKVVKKVKAGCNDNMGELCALQAGVYYKGNFANPANPELAVELYEKACNLSSVRGCYKLGEALRDGRGVKHDVGNGTYAVEIFKNLCTRGEVTGCAYLGYAYMTGQGVVNDYGEAHKLFEKSCKNGGAWGCSNLGLMYSNGWGVTRDYKRAFEYFEKGCDRGDFWGCQRVGMAFRDGSGVVENDAKALEIFEAQCSEGYAAGCVHIGYLYEEGQGVTQNYKQAEVFYEQGCSEGEAWGCSNLGELYATGRGVIKDENISFDRFKQGCDGGNEYGCRKLGEAFRDGKGVSKDEEKAFNIFEKQCLKGDETSCVYFGYAFENGQGVSQDLHRAALLYEDACTKNIAWGCSRLAFLHETGQGVAKDENIAFDRYKQGCDGEDNFGCWKLGEAFRDGKGVSKDEEKAFNIFKKQCLKGDETSCVYFGYAFENGQGVSQDLHRAALLYEDACTKNIAWGCSRLAFLHEHGAPPIPQNFEKAIEYYTKGCEGGNDWGCEQKEKMDN